MKIINGPEINDEEEPNATNLKLKGVQFSEDVEVSTFNKDTEERDVFPETKSLAEVASNNNLPNNAGRIMFKRGSVTSSGDLLRILNETARFKKLGEDYEKLTSHKAGQVLGMLQDEVETTHPDAMKQMKSAHLFFASNKTPTWEEEDNPSDEYLEEKEQIRLEKLKRDRGHCFTRSFDIIFHITVCLNFLMAWVDSCKIIVEESKFQILLLRNEYNCLDIVHTADWLDHCVNIFHALMSSCVLFAENKVNAAMCMAYVFSQAIHTSFKCFEFFTKLRFEDSGTLALLSGFLIFIVLLDVVTSIVVIQRFYDLTDRVRSRAKYFATTMTDGKSMNDDIIYQNQSSFLQRKHILREAIASQVYTVILKIDNYRLKGLEADHVALYRELHAAKAALKDVDGVDNVILLKELRKANAQRLKMFDTDPSLLQTKSALLSGTMSIHKLFKVEFGDRLHFSRNSTDNK